MFIVNIVYNCAIFIINIYIDRDVDVTLTLCIWIISYIDRVIVSIAILIGHILIYVVKPLIICLVSNSRWKYAQNENEHEGPDKDLLASCSDCGVHGFSLRI